MHTHTTDARANIHIKRDRLRELVSRLGATATPAAIREVAYREGIGQISSAMLVFVRNELWPNRPRRTRGRPVGAAATVVTVSGAADFIGLCPACLRPNTVICTRHIRKDGSTSRSRLCKDCGHRFLTIHPDSSPHPRIERLKHMLATEKECSKCKRVLPVDSFGKKARDPHLYRSQCKDCACHERKASYRSNRGILATYGITSDQYFSMLTAQNGKCLICGNPESGKRGERKFPLGIDHCHATGIVRGLLCNKCNLGIGNFNDDIGRLESALHYLRRHKPA